MITRDQVTPLLLEACPSFVESWEKRDDQDLLYILMGDLAHHLLLLFQQGDIGEFKPVCEVIERFHLEGDDYVRELATIGFLEGIQNIWMSNDHNPQEFVKYLLPESKKWWKELNDFWNGEIPYVGAGLR